MADRRSLEPKTDRGEARREAILAAAARILGRDGIGAVTHRAIAAEADVSLAATTYYFASKSELLTEALQLLAGAELARLEARAAELGPEQYRAPDKLAAAITDVLLPRSKREREAILAKYELYLEAARRPELRPTAKRWIESFRTVATGALAAAGASNPAAKAPLLVAAIDGMLMHQLACADRGDSVRAERLRLQELIIGLTA